MRADGSGLERGIHLRWQMGEGLGFPRRGFDLYRREQNLDPFIRCGILFIRDDGGIIWVSEQAGFAPKIEIKSSGESRPIEGCGQKPAYSILLPGRQSIEIEFKEPGRHLRITLDGRTTPAPVATAFWRSGGGAVL